MGRWGWLRPRPRQLWAQGCASCGAETDLVCLPFGPHRPPKIGPGPRRKAVLPGRWRGLHRTPMVAALLMTTPGDSGQALA